MKLRTRLGIAVGTVSLLCGALAFPSSASVAEAHHVPRPHFGQVSAPLHRSSAGGHGSLLTRQGYLVPDEAAYQRTKARLAARSSFSTTNNPGVVALPSPAVLENWQGLADSTVAPSDSTGAIGTTRYIETVNDKVGIYSRAGGLLRSGQLEALGGGGSPYVTDPQMIWDPGTGRFYYEVLDITRTRTGTSDNRLEFGYSKTTSPADLSTSSWCKYFFSFTSALPDYPKLGDTSNFLMFGTNVFSVPGGSYLGSVTYWVTKPGAGTTCQSPSTFKFGAKSMGLPGGGQAWTPVPVNQIDPGGAGYILASDDVAGGGSSSRLVEYTVTKSVSGGMAMTSPVAVSVPTYSAPPPALQSNGQYLDTLDGRLMDAVSSMNPATGKVMIWTQHTEAGTSGTSAVRWFEIDAAGHAEQSTGIVDDGSHFFFNASISPDRKVNGTTAIYGNSAVMGFDSVSAAQAPTVLTASITPLGDSSAATVVSSSGPEIDFSCPDPGNTCRWGDYAGATPDPNSSSYANNGVVWLTSMYSTGVNDSTNANWITQNWSAVPDVTATMTPLPLFTKATDFTVGWSNVAGSVSYDSQYRAAPFNGAFGSEAPFTADGASTSSLFSAATGGPATEGDTYCFSVQPHDGSDVGHGYTRETCTAIPVDDRSLSFGALWTKLSSTSGWFDDTLIAATKTGTSVSLAGVQAKHVSILVGKCPTCGSIKIYFGATLLKTVSLHAATIQNGVSIAAGSFTSLRTGTLKVVVSSSAHPVRIDGFEASRL